MLSHGRSLHFKNTYAFSMFDDDDDDAAHRAECIAIPAGRNHIKCAMRTLDVVIWAVPIAICMHLDIIHGNKVNDVSMLCAAFSP